MNHPHVASLLPPEGVVRGFGRPGASDVTAPAHRFIEHETRALLTRLARIKPFVLSQTMVPAANISPAAQRAIEDHLALGRDRLREQGLRFIASLERGSRPAEAQRGFAMLRLRFNAVLSQFDLFADALSQRGDRDHGVWMAGLDALATDALVLPGFYEAPPVLCYLDRGIGAAIRRARTRLPGGGENPAAIIRVPRERLVGSGIASSLVHEVGHQAAALLDLVNSLRPMLRQQAEADAAGPDSTWLFWERWVSEIVADLWSVARLGIASTLGLIGVLSLPRAFVFRIGGNDPHPAPWIRVLLSGAIGAALYPDRQWARLDTLWRELYPLEMANEPSRALFDRLAQNIPVFVAALLDHRPPSLGGRAIAQLASANALHADALRSRFERWQADPKLMLGARPCLACAVIGQGRADGRLAPQAESRLMARLLTHWALRASLSSGTPCVAPPRAESKPVHIELH